MELIFEDEMGERIDLLYGDCREFNSTSQFDFIFADPPFNIWHGYYGYDDCKTEIEYKEFTREWLMKCVELLSPTGVLAIHCPDAIVCNVLRYTSITRIDWIIWHYRFGQAGSVANATKYINSHEHLLVFAKNAYNYTFNPHVVPSDRATKYNDVRTLMTDTPGERVALNVWGLPDDGKYWGRVQGNNKERRPNHPNQLPELYVSRAFRSWSNQGDNCFCPFGGSGTETVVASALGRNIVTTEISKPNCLSIVERIKEGVVRDV